MAGYVKKDEKTGTYYYVLEKGKDRNGKRIRSKKRGFKNEKEAKKALYRAITELDDSDFQPDKPMSIREYLLYWLETYAEPNTTAKTFTEYRRMCINHIIPALGDTLLNKLTTLQIQKYYSSKLVSLSAQSVKHQHRLLSKALNDALDWGMISKSSIKGVKPPKTKKVSYTTLTQEQLRKLLEVAKETTVIYYSPIFCAAHTGMRMSEIIGLPWYNVDFDTNKIYVRQTITFPNGKACIQQMTKGGNWRAIELTKPLRELLLKEKDKHEENKQLLGNAFNPLNLVFTNSIGNLIQPSELTRGFKKSLKKADLPNIRFHDLRHSHATILLQNKIQPKVVSERLGHSKISITMDTYSHVLPIMQEEAAKIFDEDDNEEMLTKSETF